LQRGDCGTLQYFYFPDGSAAPVTIAEPDVASDGTGLDFSVLSSFSVLAWPLQQLSTPLTSTPEFSVTTKAGAKANEAIGKFSKEDRGVQVKPGTEVPVIGTHGSTTTWQKVRNDPDETIKFVAKTHHGLENLGFF
jgi:hypothetical protein